MRGGFRILPAAALGVCFAAERAEAHAFGVRYDLPLPLGLYLSAAGAAVALSFVVTAAFAARRDGRPLHPFLVLSRDPDAWPLLRPIRLALCLIGVALLLLILAAGFLGASSPTSNIAPLLVWVVWWVGFLLFTAFVGNLWPLLSPWSAVYDGVARLLPAARRRLPTQAFYPRWLGSWPAAILLLAFVWLELVGSLGESPRALAGILLLFTVFAVLVMAWFGRTTWLSNVDPFHKVFDLLGGFAPLGRSRRMPGHALLLRVPGMGLAERRAESLSDVALIMILLGAVIYDGLTETPLWASALDWVSRSEALRRPLLTLANLGLRPLDVVETVGLLAAPLILSALYAFFSLATALAVGKISTAQVMRNFAPSLLPIAIAYHLSHYLSYLLLAGQLVVPLASDPFGLGWNLFGTRHHAIDVGIIGAKTVWYVSVVALVSGHVISVVLAHLEAMRCLPTAKAAVVAQIPFLILMVGFTVCSLWILAQPVVSGP